MNMFFPEIKKNFGFGCMRFPMIDGEIDNKTLCEMIDYFIENGFNYFDTAHGYHNGKSEIALKNCLTSRYPRDKYVLTNKLSSPHFNSKEEIRPLFNKQLSICGVEYFDFYLMHAQNATLFEKYKRCEAYETAFELKKEGKIHHVGISFHDKAEVLDRILTEYPQIEVVQIQFNYVDYNDESVESKKCYDVCCKHGKPVIVMEPVKGGILAKLPEKAKSIFDNLKGGSPASYAIRFAASFKNNIMVISGMGSNEMMIDNIGYMKNFVPLNADEYKAVEKVCSIFREQDTISCTACHYCTERCPIGIPIPDLFSCFNDKKTFQDWNSNFYYHEAHTASGVSASSCIKCGKCEEVCPQKLKIRDLLKSVSDEFESEPYIDE